MTIPELISHFEHLRYQIVCFPADGSSPLPTSVGSGFMLDYHGETIFITADHVVNTHDNGVRHIETKDIAISTNQIIEVFPKVWNTVLVPVGGFIYCTPYRLDMQTGQIVELPLFDAAFSVLTDKQINSSYITCEVNMQGAKVPMGEPKIHLPETCIIAPSANAEYCVFGRVRFELQNVNGINVLNSTQIFHDGLHYVRDEGDYYVLSSPRPVIIDDWKGLSGSAIMDHDGGLIGILCKGNAASNEIYVKKIQMLLPLMDAEIMTSHGAISNA